MQTMNDLFEVFDARTGEVRARVRSAVHAAILASLWDCDWCKFGEGWIC
jgi:hypothetical protein